MKVVIASDSFKGTLTSAEAGAAMREGVLQIWPDADVCVVPIADGGEGTVEAVLTARGGDRRSVTVRGPLGDDVVADFALLDDGRTAVVEMAASSGLTLVPPDARDPTRTTTYGTGQQIVAALNADVERIYIGIGGSATVDGGAGCGQALGVRFLDRDGAALPAGLSGGDLQHVERIDAAGRDARLGGTELVVLCDVDNPLCGPTGAAATYGPQKGASREQVAQLDRNLNHLARVIERDLGMDVSGHPGSGAAGGLGAGLVAFAGAVLRQGVETIMDLSGLTDWIQGADLVISGEGRIDAQTVRGKAVSGVADRARRAGVRVVAIGGSLGPGADQCGEILDGIFGALEPGDAIPATKADATRILTSATLRHLSSWPT
jgi:glycerate kinase